MLFYATDNITHPLLKELATLYVQNTFATEARLFSEVKRPRLMTVNMNGSVMADRYVKIVLVCVRPNEAFPYHPLFHTTLLGSLVSRRPG